MSDGVNIRYCILIKLIGISCLVLRHAFKIAIKASTVIYIRLINVR